MQQGDSSRRQQQRVRAARARKVRAAAVEQAAASQQALAASEEEEEKEAAKEEEEAREGWVRLAYVAAWDPCDDAAGGVAPLDAVREAGAMCRDLEVIRSATQGWCALSVARSLLRALCCALCGSVTASPRHTQAPS